MAIESKAAHFENPGVVNTDEVLRIAKQRAVLDGLDCTSMIAQKGLGEFDGVPAFPWCMGNSFS